MRYWPSEVETMAVPPWERRVGLSRSNIPGALETYTKLIKKGRFLDEVIFDLREALLYGTGLAGVAARLLINYDAADLTLSTPLSEISAIGPRAAASGIAEAMAATLRGWKPQSWTR